ncbi:asparagine synthase (glutamine-hydrolyzing) [bacterium]|nr:asparagine synthase (glutamine-hydrolyzing) [bacterium]
MCGITGFYNPSGSTTAVAADIVSNMADVITHRGPDDNGIWIGDNNTLALAHRRLAIIDVSVAGHQPMVSSTGRFTIIFNGEIYNYRELKDSLNRSAWRGESDTEVLLEAIEQWGLTDALTRCNGMFAFALWDRNSETISLVRDRIGEKPLYYGWCQDVFVFGSELKSIKAHPSFEGTIDKRSVTLYFNHGFIPAPASIYEGIFKLNPATILTLSLSLEDFRHPQIENYWTIGESIDQRNIEQVAEDQYLAELENRLTRAVIQQSVADVPLGSFLSGGIDSSLITAILQRHTDRQVETFSLGFNEEKYNEARYAKSVANFLGTAHHEFIVTPDDLQSIVPSLAQMYDEPFGDPSAIPTHIVSKFARSSVTVALTGDGGDELFGGYTHYHRSAQIWSNIKKIPFNIRSLSASVLNPIGALLYNTSKGRKLERLTNYLSCNSMMDCYRVQTCASKTELRSLLRSPIKIDEIQIPSNLDGFQAMMFSDSKTYLPDDILVKVDRAGMSVSLETRAPFLDHHVADFAFTLPMKYKINDGNGKLILRDLLAKYIPRKLFERPKMGFGLPIDDWLRDSLRSWAEDLLSEKSLTDIGLFNVNFIRNRWEKHTSGIEDWHYFLWDLLMFIEWYRNELKLQKIQN